jgi:hypothetical protein
MKSTTGDQAHSFSLVTNHGRVLASIAAHPDARLRDIAATVGITERTAHQIVSDLERAGYLTRTRVGRRNRYQLDGQATIPTPRVRALTVGQLLGLLGQALEHQSFL